MKGLAHLEALQNLCLWCSRLTVPAPEPKASNGMRDARRTKCYECSGPCLCILEPNVPWNFYEIGRKSLWPTISSICARRLNDCFKASLVLSMDVYPSPQPQTKASLSQIISQDGSTSDPDPGCACRLHCRAAQRG